MKNEKMPISCPYCGGSLVAITRHYGTRSLRMTTNGFFIEYDEYDYKVESKDYPFLECTKCNAKFQEQYYRSRRINYYESDRNDGMMILPDGTPAKNDDELEEAIEKFFEKYK